MSEQAIQTEQQETKEQVWERTVRKPITKEAVRGEDPKAAETRAPDRALITPEITALLQAKQPKKVDPLEERLAAIESAVRPPEPEPELNEQQELLATLRGIAEREQALLAQKEQDAYDARVNEFKKAAEEHLVANKEKYPGLVKAKLTGNVIDALVNELTQGKAVSDDEIASKAEKDLYSFYLELKEAYEPNKAKDQPSSEENKPQPTTKTLTGSLASGTEALTAEELYLKYGKAGASMAWDRTMKTQ